VEVEQVVALVEVLVLMELLALMAVAVGHQTALAAAVELVQFTLNIGYKEIKCVHLQ
jgi:hypothetical protein